MMVRIQFTICWIPTIRWQRVQGAISSSVPEDLPQGMRAASAGRGRREKRREERRREKRRGFMGRLV